MHTSVTLSTGVRVVNFSSPHPFTFTDGSILPAVEAEIAKTLMLEQTEIESEVAGPAWTDIALSFSMSPAVKEALSNLQDDESCDIILVPFPVMEAIKQLRRDNRHPTLFSKARVCRVADRVAKTVCHDRFCI